MNGEKKNEAVGGLSPQYFWRPENVELSFLLPKLSHLKKHLFKNIEKTERVIPFFHWNISTGCKAK